MPGSNVRRAWGGFAAVLLFAFAVRVALLFWIAPNAGSWFPAVSTSLGKTFDGYHEIALQLAAGRGFALDAHSGPTAARAPLYPLLLAALYRLFGVGAGPILFAHAILGALTCALLYVTGRRMFGAGVGLTAGFLFAVFPPHLWWSQYVMSETLLVALMVGAFLGLLRFVQEPSTGRAAAAGALLGLTALCNAMILFLPLVLIGAAVAAPGPRKTHLRYAPVLLLAMGVILMPWTGRNALVFHRLIPVNWSVGLQYMKGLIMADDYASGRARDLGSLDGSSMVAVLRILRDHGYAGGDYMTELREFQRTQTVGLAEDDLLKRLSLERIRKQPTLALRKWAMNLPLYWYLSNHFMLLNQVTYFGLIALALTGLALGAWRAIEAQVLVLFCLYFWLGYSAVLVSARFALQIAPLLTLLAAYAIVALARRARRAPTAAVPTAAG